MRYGTSAAPLARRHPGRMAPFVVHPWSVLIAGLALTRHPLAAVSVAGVQSVVLTSRLRPVGVPAATAALWPLRGAAASLLGAGRAASALAPAGLLALATTRRGRATALVLLTGPPLVEWVRRRPRLDPLRWTLLCLVDDAAYGAGVWLGCLRERTLDPVRITRRAA
jgi:hypothetical protein